MTPLLCHRHRLPCPGVQYVWMRTCAAGSKGGRLMTSRSAVSILLDDACSSLANRLMEIHADLGNISQQGRRGKMRNRPPPRSELERGKVARSAEMLLGNMMARNETRRENEIGEDDNDGAPWKESTE